MKSEPSASDAPPQNPITLVDYLERWKGSTVETDLRKYHPRLAAIRELESELRGLDDDGIHQRATDLRGRCRSSEMELDPQLDIEAFALMSVASERVLSQRPFDEQLVAGLAMLSGRVVEMQTGEGKTLAAVAPAFRRALDGRGVHVLTFNDYLAQRDGQWMAPIYQLLGLSVGWVDEGCSSQERRSAYAADVTYVTAKEAGFDWLRDGLVTDPSEKAHRPLSFALVDEADSLLIDEARIPLVIAGHGERRASNVLRLSAMVRDLRSGIHYKTDENDRNVGLTEAGVRHMEDLLGLKNLNDEENLTLVAELHCALHVEVLLRRDVDYLVRAGKIEVVDELTGRVVEDRHWPDGLQAALEAKEGLEQGSDGRMLGSITLQHFLGLYPQFCGMTGTARDSADELRDFYTKPVTVIPTHRPMIRVDHPDRIFTHRQAKENAVIEEIKTAHGAGRPVLVGTLSVAESERLAEQIRRLGISCRTLNAKNDAEEAEIVAQAGALGAVTIATNMAGRGTDIRLGGDHASEQEQARVKALGGLYVIGTHRNESVRIDRQLRGRAGRQGDPGESRFFVSLEDEMLVRFGLPELIPKAMIPEPQAEPLDIELIRREVIRAQRIVDGQNREIRKTLYKYAQPIEDQRLEMEQKRQTILEQGFNLWRQERPETHRSLVELWGQEAVEYIESQTALFHLDRLWSEHLANIADLRESNHLVGLAGEDPLTRFHVETAQLFHALWPELDDTLLSTLEDLAASPTTEAPDIATLGIKGPSSTWTYLINDDPFRNQLSRVLSGPGNTTMSIGAALVAPVLFLAWLLTDRLKNRRR